MSLLATLFITRIFALSPHTTRPWRHLFCSIRRIHKRWRNLLFSESSPNGRMVRRHVGSGLRWCVLQRILGRLGICRAPEEPVFAPNKSRLLSDRCTCPFLIEITPAAVSSGYGVIRNGQAWVGVLEATLSSRFLYSCRFVEQTMAFNSTLFVCSFGYNLIIRTVLRIPKYTIDPLLMASDRL